MSYFNDVYKRRGKLWGETEKERYINQSKKFFEDYLLNSPNADFVYFNNKTIKIAIHSNTQEESKLTKIFLIGLENLVIPGDLIKWKNEDWLIIEKTEDSFEAYQKLTAVKCNYNLKWLDDYGIAHSQSCYLCGIMDKVVSSIFAINSELLLPKIDDTLQIILPFVEISKGQKLIIKNQAWKVSARDFITINNLLYLSLMEDKVNNELDNENYANTNLINNSFIDIGFSTLTIGINQNLNINPTLYCNGLIKNTNFIYSLENTNTCSMNGNILSGLAIGENSLTIVSTDTKVSTTIPIVIISTNSEIIQIIGSDSIKNGRARRYSATINNGTIVEIPATFVITSGSELVSIVSYDTFCNISANNLGNTGKIILEVNTTYGVFAKEITIDSLL